MKCQGRPHGLAAYTLMNHCWGQRLTSGRVCTWQGVSVVQGLWAEYVIVFTFFKGL